MDTIILGTININWHFAKGTYTCECMESEDADAFDRVICGILYRSNGVLPKYRIASIMGFNVIDNPTENKYVDCSEKAIFDNAIKSLSKYKIIDAEGDTIRLTELGRRTAQTGKKQNSFDEQIELAVDEFCGKDFNIGIFNDINVRKIEQPQNSGWNILEHSDLEVRDVLNIQRHRLVDSDRGKSVGTITRTGMDYYVATLNCEVCYNLRDKRFSVRSSSDGDEINRILNERSNLKRHERDFFNNYQESILTKQEYQEEKERRILNSPQVISELDILTCIDCFYKQLSLLISKKNIRIVYFSVQNVTNEIQESLRRELKNVIVCVDYVNGDFNQNVEFEGFIRENNIIYHRVQYLRMEDLCAYSSYAYFSVKQYVVDYQSRCYAVPLVYGYNGNKYNPSALFAPFANDILDRVITIGRDKSIVFKTNPSADIINNLRNILKNIDEINIINEDNRDKRDEFARIVNEIMNEWKDIISEELDHIEADSITGENRDSLRNKLNQIKNEMDLVGINDENVQKRFNEVEQRLNAPTKIKGPTIIVQKRYILDTSIFMDRPDILNRFNMASDKIIIPRIIEQELDGLTHDPDKAENARKALVLLRNKEKYNPQFLSIKNDVKLDILPPGFDPNKNDNHMLATAIECANNNDTIIIVTNDVQFKTNVDSCIKTNTISDKIEAINLAELLLRFGD